MNDKKLTDEEIIKRLELCVKRGNRNYDTDIVLDLIYRQQEDIDELKHEREVLIEDIHCSADKINEQLEEIERLNNNISAMVVTLRNSAKATRNEAIKEFAYRLKQKSEYYENGQGWEGRICYEDDIDKLVKEMVGDTE